MDQSQDSHHLSTLMMLGSQLLSNGNFNEGLPSFVTRGLDVEQIWQQLELRNEHKLSLTACTRNAARIESSKNRQKKKSFKDKMKNIDKKEVTVEANEEETSSDDSDGENDNMIASIKKRLAEDPVGEDDDFNGLSGSDSEADDDVDFDFQLDNEIVKGLSDEEDSGVKKKKEKTSKSKISKRSTIVDDKFFKLADMEEFLDIEDLKEEKKINREKKGVEESDDDEDESSDEEAEEEIDMFGDMDSDEDESGNAKYADFFDPPYHDGEVTKTKKKSKSQDDGSQADSEADDSNTDQLNTTKENSVDNEEEEDEELKGEEELEDDEEMEEDNEDEEEEEDEEMEEDKEDEEEEDDDVEVESQKDSKKKVSFTDDLLQSEDEDVDNESSKTDGETKSTFELKQEELQKKAREMEDLSLKEASWELKGEATASRRPENSLLETVLDFQHSTRAAPVITDETTKTIEDYIKQRIKDKAFDDVERKEKPKEDAFEFKKRIVLDQEKSKLSLGELYEQEFLKQQQQDDEDVKADPECEKIEKQLNKLFHQLDALSNFRYTPMKPGTEVKIMVNTPAIAMEEVAPVATADSELLAPEEVYDKKKGDVKALDERDVTDKKRALRQKKKEKRERKKAKEAREKAVDKMNPGLGNKYSKEKAKKQLEQLSKTDKSVTMIKGDRQKLGSSTAFFNQLQDEVQTNVRAKKGSKEGKKRKVDASLLML